MSAHAATGVTPTRTVVRHLLTHLIVPVLLATGMALAYLGAFHQPAPHGVRLDVVGTGPAVAAVAQGLQDGLGDMAAVRTVGSVDEARAALEHLTDRMAANAAATRAKLDFDRTLSCRIPDLDVAFHARLSGGQIHDVTDGEDPEAKLKLTAGSDDLVALVKGKLNVASAWASGRIKIDASLMDMMKLRKLL